MKRQGWKLSVVNMAGKENGDTSNPVPIQQLAHLGGQFFLDERVTFSCPLMKVYACGIRHLNTILCGKPIFVAGQMLMWTPV